MHIFLALCVIAVFSTNVQAEIRIPSIVGSNAVIQAGPRASIFGYATPLETISVIGSDGTSFSTRTDSTGLWKCFIGNRPRSYSKYSFSVSGSASSTVVISNVMFGDVWICSGQSNMQYSFATRKIKYPDYPESLETAEGKIRLFHQRWEDESQSPLLFNNGSKWFESDKHGVSRFSIVGYLFALHLNKELDIPIGIVGAYMGGTHIYQWFSPSHTDKQYCSYPGTFEKYNAQVAHLTNADITGVIWYQGESDRQNKIYDKLMYVLVSGWRKSWKKYLPFIYVQLPSFGKKDYTSVRELQRRAQSIPRAYMVTSIDCGSYTDIHPPDKEPIANRLAQKALGFVYKTHRVANDVQFVSAKRSGHEVCCKFYSNGEQFTVQGPSGFEIAGRDGVFFPAKYRTYGREWVILTSEVEIPAYVRYLWKAYPSPDIFDPSVGVNIRNRDGIPMSPFFGAIENTSVKYIQKNPYYRRLFYTYH